MTEPRTAAGRTCRFCGSPGQFGVLLDHEHLDPDWAKVNGYADEVAAWAEATPEVADFVEWAKQIEDFPVPFIRTAKDDAYRTISVTDLSILRDYAKRLAAHAAPEEK